MIFSERSVILRLFIFPTYVATIGPTILWHINVFLIACALKFDK